MTHIRRMPLSDWLNFTLWLSGSGLALYGEWILPVIGGTP